MQNICILTDTTAQYPKSSFPGQELVKTVPLNIYLGNTLVDSNQIKIRHLPSSIDENHKPKLIPPSPEQFRETFNHLWQSYESIICVFLSSKLNPCYENALEAISTLSDTTRISIFDSQTLSIGLGYIVQTAAEAASKNQSIQDIERVIYQLISRIYTIFCISGLTYLHAHSIIDYGQAIIGEMLNMIPIFTLEEGVLIPLEKMRNFRHTLDYYLEFLYEFDRLEYICLLQSTPPKPQLTRLLRENIKHHFSTAAFSENKLNLPVSLIVGPRSTGLVAIEPNHN